MSNNIDNINKEYKDLRNPRKYTKYYSRALTNIDKNRYNDILPYNKYIVNIKDNKYINASYLPGINGRNTYISCQAPLPGTIHDFYNMILDNDISVIVMLTVLISKDNDVKAHCYWPINTYKLYDIEIKLLSANNVGNNIMIRKLQITRDNEDPIIVHQIHYKGWPDRNIPEDGSFNQLISLARNLHKTGKLLAHCSAGIGRAGTFLAVYSYLEYYLSENPETVFNIVNNFRKQRLLMVQELKQYIFIYTALNEYLKMLGYDYIVKPKQ